MVMADSTEKHSGSIPSTEGLPIYYDLYLPNGVQSQRLPVLIFLHGFKGFKDWGAFPRGCKKICEAGFAVMAFNFSLNGVGEDMKTFDQLELFARETLSQDLEDVRTIIQAVKDKNIFAGKELLDTDKIGIIGHSRGGHTAVVAAAEHPEVRALVTWSAVADYNDRWSDAMINDWKEKGVTQVKNGRTGQMMPMGEVVYQDALQHADRLMAVKRISEITTPSLFIHGKEDEAVSIKEAEKLYKHCSADVKKMELVEGAGHTFETSHPFGNSKLPSAFTQVLNLTKNWFIKYLY